MISRILLFSGVFLLFACNDNIHSNNQKNKINSDLQIIEYKNLDVLELECKEIASNFYTLHDVKISNFYQVTQELGSDFNKDGYIDSIYLLTPINQLLDRSECLETVESDTIILLVFKNNVGEQNVIKIYRNLFCPLAPLLIYRELDFNNDAFTLTKDFGFGNGRKVNSKLHFSWKEDDFYADSIEISVLENGIEEIFKEDYDKKLSKLKNIDCEYF